MKFDNKKWVHDNAYVLSLNDINDIKLFYVLWARRKNGSHAEYETKVNIIKVNHSMQCNKLGEFLFSTLSYYVKP